MRTLFRSSCGWLAAAAFSCLASLPATAEDGLRLAVSHGFHPAFPSLKVFIDNDPCAAPQAPTLDVVAVVETLDAASDEMVLLSAVNSANQKLLTSLQPDCVAILKSPFTAEVTTLLDGTPVTEAVARVSPGQAGRPLPEITIASKAAVAEPATTETPLGNVVAAFFNKHGPMRDGFRVNPALNLKAATADVIALEASNPEIANDLGLLTAQLYTYAQSHPRQTSPETMAKYRALSSAGSAMATNQLLRMRYSELADIVAAIRRQEVLEGSLQEVWLQVYPIYAEGLQNGAFAAYDIQQAAIAAGAQVSGEGFVYNVYDGPRREDVERGLATAASETSALGGLAPSSRFGAYANRHYSCDGTWCDFGDGMSKWRLISRGRPSCDFVEAEKAFCRFPWRFNMQLGNRFFGANSPYQAIMTSMNAANWMTGEALFVKSSGVWEMSGPPDLAKK